MQKNHNRLYRLFLCITIAFSVILLFSTLYPDIMETTKASMNIWTSLFDGHPLKFYEYCAKDHFYTPQKDIGWSDGSGAGAAYDITLYLIFAFWNFPMWLLDTFTNIDIFHNFFCLVYMKSILVVAIVVLIYYCFKIIELAYPSFSECIGNKSEMLILLLGSISLSSSIYIIGQYDILSICFMFAGIYYYLTKNDKCFYIFS